MDIGVIIGTIGTIIGVIALIVSILGLFYTRRRTRIMEEQLIVVREETEKKRTLEEASKAIRQAISMIKEYSDSDYFFFPPLDLSRDNILAHMHDKHLKTLQLHIKPKSLKVPRPSDGKYLDIKTAEELTKVIKSWYNVETLYVSGSLDFDCDPNILGNSFIELGDAFKAVMEFYRAHKILKFYDYIIDVFDSTVLDKLEQTIDLIVEAIFKSMMSKHEINFSSTDKSEEILRKLQNVIVGRNQVLTFVRELSDEICDQRLPTIQKAIFLKS